MRINSFTQNMLKKSNADLQHILKDKDAYTDEAIQAVIWELENRNLIEKDTVVHIPVAVKEPLAIEIKPSAEESSFDDLELTSLYSKVAILGFSIFFSTLFGVVLLMSNLKKSNKPKARIEVLIFGVVYTFFTVVIFSYLPTAFLLPLVFNILGYLVLTEYFWNKYLGKTLQFKKKPITKPLLISLTFLALIVVLQLIPGLLNN